MNKFESSPEDLFEEMMMVMIYCCQTQCLNQSENDNQQQQQQQEEGEEETTMTKNINSCPGKMIKTRRFLLHSSAREKRSISPQHWYHMIFYNCQ